jgi:hypothetical protein
MKLRLEMDGLRVETFETTAAAERGRGGTVRGNDASHPYQCATGDPSCPDTACQETCGLSCGGSCIATFGDCCPDS